MAQTVRDFIDDCYRLVSPDSPTMPLHGNDMSKGIQYLNELIASYASSGQMLTIQKKVSLLIPPNTSTITFGDATSGADITEGRLANVSNSWLELLGVTYPLSPVSRFDFDQTYRFAPLKGLPRFIIINFDTTTTEATIYPGTSQGYEFFLTGKFQPGTLDKDSDMSGLPLYFTRFLRPALARDIAMYKGRSEAWTEKLETMYREAYSNMVAVTPINLKVNADHDALLNGSHRVRSGI